VVAFPSLISFIPVIKCSFFSLETDAIKMST
jgi:hypothetical protein